MPTWLGVPVMHRGRHRRVWICFTLGAGWPLTFVECANHLMTALLLVFVFRRFSPGMVLSVLGFVAWSAPSVADLPRHLARIPPSISTLPASSSWAKSLRPWA